jgi:signal transduction histidine kinase
LHWRWKTLQSGRAIHWLIRAVGTGNALVVGLTAPWFLQRGAISAALLPGLICAIAGVSTVMLQADRNAQKGALLGALAPIVWINLDEPILLALLGCYGFMLWQFGARSHTDLRELLLLRLENQQTITESEDRRAQAESAELAKTRFFAAASHDLKQPLAALAWRIEALQEDARAEQKAEIFELAKQARSSLALVEELLDFSQGGLTRPQMQSVNLGALVRESADRWRAFATSKGLVVRVRAAQVSIQSDPSMLRRIVNNLLDNALHYTTRGGVLLAVRRRRSEVWLEVIDTGVGIAPEHLLRVFEEFYRVQPLPHSQHFGLGLALAQRFANVLGLRLNVVSRHGRGSCFRICAPWSPTNTADTSTRLRILAIATNSAVRDHLRRELGGANSLTLAYDLPHALRCASAHSLPPDLVLAPTDLAQQVQDRLDDEFNLRVPTIGLAEVVSNLPQLPQAANTALLFVSLPIRATQIIDRLQAMREAALAPIPASVPSQSERG